MPTLDLGLIGNCAVNALIDRDARIVWHCLPRPDGDPVFHALLGGAEPGAGAFGVALENQTGREQEYVEDSAVLRTRLHAPEGSVEIVDFAPRYRSEGQIRRPAALVRRVRPIAGRPTITVACRPGAHYGTVRARPRRASEQRVSYTAPLPLDLVASAPREALDETAFALDREIAFVFGPDAHALVGAGGDALDTAQLTEAWTLDYWRGWTRRLALPLDYQEAVIRAAVTLKLCVHEPTGAILAAVTTSIPEAPGSERTWDYRYCWIRDSFFTLRALADLGAIGTLSGYQRWLMGVLEAAGERPVQPLFGVGGEPYLPERFCETLPGYRGQGPVRIGNQAHEHSQHDVYGQIVLSAAPVFFDRRLSEMASPEMFELLERAGDWAVHLHDKPDAGLWELRTRSRVHTSSALMCWAACDRLGRVADALGRPERARHWSGWAERIGASILEHAWNAEIGAYAESFGGHEMDASLLLMAEFGLVDGRDPRFLSTLDRIEAKLAHGPHLHRYEGADDFGVPEVAFNLCSIWWYQALARAGRTERAAELFEGLLARRNHLGLLSEDVDYASGELWGNFPQTYSMVGIINAARLLSRPWSAVV
ncbi:MAG: glycoside hydrolase family 15 protein [Paracoccaceae bacterium]